VARRIKRVFISYSSEDKIEAELVCGALEGEGLRCYLAHRDNRGGTLWDEAILDALDSAAAVVRVLSAAANASPYVKREIERAASRDIPIAPLRIADVAPGRSLEFFIKIHHWLDGFPAPLEQHLPLLVASVRQLVDKKRGARGDPNVNVYPYMVARGPAAHQAFVQRPGEPWDKTIRGTETIENLRAKLVAAPLQLRNPVDIKVQGTLSRVRFCRAAGGSGARSPRSAACNGVTACRNGCFTASTCGARRGISPGTASDRRAATAIPTTSLRSAMATKPTPSRYCCRPTRLDA
jgi:TIR domain